MQVIQKELAKILGISTRRIQQLAAENGMFKSKTGTKYDLADCVQDYIKFKIESETSGKNDLDYWQEKAKHEQAKRTITQMKLARMKRESFDAADVEDAWAALLIEFKDELKSLPHKLAPLLIGMEDMAEIARTVEFQIDGALFALSQFDLDKINNNDEMPEEDEDEEEYPKVIAERPSDPAAGENANRQRVGRRKSQTAGR